MVSDLCSSLVLTVVTGQSMSDGSAWLSKQFRPILYYTTPIIRNILLLVLGWAEGRVYTEIRNYSNAACMRMRVGGWWPDGNCVEGQWIERGHWIAGCTGGAGRLAQGRRCIDSRMGGLINIGFRGDMIVWVKDIHESMRYKSALKIEYFPEGVVCTNSNNGQRKEWKYVFVAALSRLKGMLIFLEEFNSWALRMAQVKSCWDYLRLELFEQYLCCS